MVGFIVPPPVMLSLLALLRHHICLMAAMFGSSSSPRLTRLDNFTKEALGRLFIGLKDFFSFSQLVAMNMKQEVRPVLAKDAGWENVWAESIGAVVKNFLHMENLDTFKVEREKTDDPFWNRHPLLQFRTPPKIPMSLHPRTFISYMLAHPKTLVYRSLKLND